MSSPADSAQPSLMYAAPSCGLRAAHSFVWVASARPRLASELPPRPRTNSRSSTLRQTRDLLYSCILLYGADQMAGWRNRMYFTGDRNTVNSCSTISILKNRKQFAWGWEIRNQTSKNRRILHESACMLAGGSTPKWAQLRRPSELAVPTVLLSEKYSRIR